MKPLVRERFNTSLRNDLVVDGRYMQGWQDSALNSNVVLELWSEALLVPSLNFDTKLVSFGGGGRNRTDE